MTKPPIRERSAAKQLEQVMEFRDQGWSANRLTFRALTARYILAFEAYWSFLPNAEKLDAYESLDEIKRVRICEHLESAELDTGIDERRLASFLSVHCINSACCSLASREALAYLAGHLDGKGR